MAISGGDGSIILSTKVDTKGIRQDLNSMVKTASKAFLAVGAAAATASVAITKMAVSAYADYEQLVGGVETLFKDSAGKVVEYANQAFATAGVSANEYMSIVTSFSASLLQSLGGDTEAAADIANQALIDMSDNANKMGTSMEAIQNAYQGFAKQNYTMLDNLKLGYGGTKTEMERLLSDAQALTGVKYDISNLADVYNAIHAIQENLGIAGTTALEAEKTISGSANAMKASWQNVLTAIAGGGDLDRAINNLVYSIQKYFENIVPVVERSLVGIGALIQNVTPMLIQSIAKSLIKAIPSLIVAIYQMIIGIAKGIYSGIMDLFSGNVQEKAFEKQIISTEKVADNIQEQADNQKELNKEMKKTLAGFDDILILSSQTAEATEISGDSFLPTTIGADATVGNEPDLMNYALKIEEALNYLLPTIETALAVIGLLLLSTGNIAWGVGFIIASAYLYSVEERSEGTFDFNVIQEDLSPLGEYIEEALIGIGLILLFFGQIPWAIGFIIAGAITYGVKEINSEEYNTDTIQVKLNIIMEAISLALIAIGIMLIFFGNVPLGLGFVIVGKKAFDVTEEKLNEGGITTKIQKFIEDNKKLIVGVSLAILVVALILCASGTMTPTTIGLLATGAMGLKGTADMTKTSVKEILENFFKENKKLIVGVSAALLAIGIILCASGTINPTSIGLIAAGAVGLASEVALNWNAIVDNIKNFVFENSTLLKLISGGLLILGILICFVNLPLGIALIAAGAVGLVTITALNYDTIVDWVKGAWEAVKGFWNKNIAPVFTLEWWKNLAIQCGNGLIAGFEGAINGIIWAFESMINWVVDGLNQISITIPDWVWGIGGETWGVNIPQADLGRVSIPRLAQGAVIPPNREFLAVLGDQRRGTNIEAPLQTIVDAFNIALSQNGGVSGNTEVILEIDGREFGRAVVEQGNKENRRIGTRLVMT